MQGGLGTAPYPSCSLGWRKWANRRTWKKIFVGGNVAAKLDILSVTHARSPLAAASVQPFPKCYRTHTGSARRLHLDRRWIKYTERHLR